MKLQNLDGCADISWKRGCRLRIDCEEIEQNRLLIRIEWWEPGTRYSVPCANFQASPDVEVGQQQPRGFL